MWQIVNKTPFNAAQGWVRGLDGAETWLVVVKASFDVLPDGSTRVAAVQPEPVRAPVHWGEPGLSAIRYENDFVLDKLTTDVVVNGTAHAPGGQAAERVDVGLRVADVSKDLRVFGQRRWAPAAAWISGPEAFVTMPIRYDRAFGGVDRTPGRTQPGWYWPNPVGMGYVDSRADAAGVPLPNVEYPDAPISAWDDRPAPAGFGFIASHWESRARLAGTCDDAWVNERQPLLPKDFQLEHCQSSPPDQRSKAFLVGGEPVVLRNLTPSGTLAFRLPRVELALRTRFVDGERVDHPPPKLHTVILEPDLPRVSLVWHTAFECHAKVYRLDHTRIDLRAEQRSLAEEDTEALLGF